MQARHDTGQGKLPCGKKPRTDPDSGGSSSAHDQIHMPQSFPFFILCQTGHFIISIISVWDHAGSTLGDTIRFHVLKWLQNPVRHSPLLRGRRVRRGDVSNLRAWRLPPASLHNLTRPLASALGPSLRECNRRGGRDSGRAESYKSSFPRQRRRLHAGSGRQDGGRRPRGSGRPSVKEADRVSPQLVACC